MGDNNFLKILKAIFSRKVTAQPAYTKISPDQGIEAPGMFVFEDDGFIYPFKSGSGKIKWTAIERLEGYKRDQWTVDEISMDITWDGWTTTFTEGMPGWSELQNKIKETFPQVPPRWETEIMQPPFAANFTVLYEREDRKMPAGANFHASFENIDRMTVQGVLEECGWKSKKESSICTELINSWTDLWLEEDGYTLLLHGLVAYHPHNVAVLDGIFDGLCVPYKYEFYNDKNELLLQVPHGSR